MQHFKVIFNYILYLLSLHSVIDKNSGTNIHNRPINSFNQPFPSYSRTRYNSPMSSSNLIKFQKLLNFFTTQSPLNILLIAKYKQSTSNQFLLFKQSMEFFFTYRKSHFITGIYNPDKSVSLFKVISPVRSDGFLAPYVPDIQFIVLVVEGFDIET